MEIDIAVIGAGAVGLAIASELAGKYKELYVFEKHRAFGREISSRSNEVIHAGLYYRNNSLKARLCTEGREMLYSLSSDKFIARKTGKLVVATEHDETPRLERLYNNARRNNVPGIRIIEGRDAKKIEPNVSSVAALHSMHSGIIDSHGLMAYYERKAASLQGGSPFIYGNEIVSVGKQKDGFRIGARDASGNSYSFKSKILINAAGLYADTIAEMAGIDIVSAGYAVDYWKAEHFSVSPRHKGKVKRPVYPLPLEHTLGVHSTTDLNGDIRLGPLMRHLEVGEIDYRVRPESREGVYSAASRYLPFLKIEELAPDRAGIMPKIRRQHSLQNDFIIKEESEKGLEGLINLIGIESPGLTASPAIGRYVAGLIGNILG